MRGSEKGKMRTLVIHIFTFPQFVEKQVEKPKSSYKTEFFLVLKNRSIFNIRKKTGKNFSVFIHQIHFDFAFRKKCFPSLFSVSTFLFTFFPFPQGIFSRISTSTRGSCLFHKAIFLFRMYSLLKFTEREKRKNLVASGFFALFQLFYIPYNHYS